jgi:ABC-type Fe3+/spermidine/putrescine transport system ATPase subunit
VTHDQEEAMAISDKIAFMDSGVLEQYDRPSSFISAPESFKVAKFFGCRNVFNGKQNGNVFETQFGGLELATRLGQGKLLAVRQEDLTIGNKPTKHSFTATVKAWQFVGSRISIDCEVKNLSGGNPVTVIVESDRFARFEINDSVEISYDPAKLHVIPRD